MAIFFICPSAMFRKKVFSEVGFFKEERFFSKTDDSVWLELLNKYEMSRNMIFTANDLEMWLRILQKFPAGIIHEKLMLYRVHPGQGTAMYSTSYENFFIVMDYYEKYARNNNLISQYYLNCYTAKKIRWRFSKGQQELTQNKFVEARRNFILFVKNFINIHFLTFKDFLKLFWTLAIIFSGPCIRLLKKILDVYLVLKQKSRQRRMNFS